MTIKTIPLCDLKEQYLNIREEFLESVDKICLESAFIKGQYVKEFEKSFVKKNNAQFGVGCSSGTSAISLALEALGIKHDDEVIVPSHSFMATAEAVCHVGAIPVFADIKESDYTISVEDIESKISKKTKAIIPVHLYGTPCDMDKIMETAKTHKLKVVEDSAQAHFAQYKGKYVGTFGDAAAFSFYPGKNLGAYGDAGFILCQSLEMEEMLKRLIDHGRLSKFDHQVVGYNHRMDSIQAAILTIKLKHIFDWTEKRREIAKAYDTVLKNNGYKVIELSEGKQPVYHIYNVEVSNRDDVVKYMAEDGIQTGIHYPISMHQMSPFEKYKTHELPVTERIINRIVSLPIYPEMSKESVDKVMDSFLKISKP